MNDIITRRVVGPQDCSLAFGIPLTREAFLEALRNPLGRDFVPIGCPDWLDYQHQVVSYAAKLLPPIEALGVNVVRDLTFGEFSSLLLQPARRIFILFAHWTDEAVEFADGLVGLHDVVEAVPLSYVGIIDLCVCHPKGLALELWRTRPNCVVKFNHSKSTPAFWLYFYLAVFKQLQDTNTTYPAALEYVIDMFLASEDNVI